ncbi:hypothetical protein TSUD_325880 [Trifolium subterraneum]|uniref:Uncharacterized protein n=1 Tax=Trifolium subterraneum TaxID=3900 RepID=A0A2Z6LI88_TRISU|nr:hypothetical protein TSUD_325880 [Trifolium subterraneum]
MEFSQDDVDRLLLSEHNRKTAEQNYAKNPLDADEALLIDPTKHYTLWCLGNANTSCAFLASASDAKVYFDKAVEYFQKALEVDPENGLYQQSLQIALKGPELHMEIQKQGLGLGQMSQGGSSASSKEQVSKKKRSNDFKYYDILGWVILAAGIVAWVGMAKSHVPPSPPS